MNKIARPALAPPDSLQGLLQRGRGAGHLRAQEEPVDVVRTQLLNSLLEDPRCDCRLEQRAEYYASLLTLLEVDLEPLEQHLRRESPSGPGPETELVVETLARLALRGRMGARRILRDYIGYGRFWSVAILWMSPVPSALEGVDQRLCARFASDEELLRELRTLPSEGEEPWDSWERDNPRLGRVLQELRRQDEERERDQEQRDVAAAAITTAQEALASSEPQYMRRAQTLERVVRREDLPLLISQLQASDPLQRAIALRGLAVLSDPAALPSLVAMADEFDRLPMIVRVGLQRALCALPAESVLEPAREWLDNGTTPQQKLGGIILRQKATPTDLNRLHRALARGLARGACSSLQDTLDTLLHLKRPVSALDVERIFAEARCSRVRGAAVRLLQATRPERFETLARECLWDCEDETRAVACRSVALDPPGVKSRLQALASDVLEEEEVRDAARARLS